MNDKTKLTNAAQCSSESLRAEWHGNELLAETLGVEERNLIAKELNYHITEEQIQSSLRAAGDPSSSEERC